MRPNDDAKGPKHWKTGNLGFTIMAFLIKVAAKPIRNF